jgi:hypothetical protein
MPFAIGERYAGFAASRDEFPVSRALRREADCARS